jgi:putative oxidoreductase
MFPHGWPGRGLLLLRLVVALILINDVIGAWMGATQSGPTALQAGAAIAGAFLLVGLWTPFAGMFLALLEIGIAFTRTGPMQATILLATLGIAFVFLGPGALSIDARLFGRKRLFL